MTDLRSSVTRELLRLEEDALYTEKAHFAAAAELQRVHLMLGLVATTGAAISVATIVGVAGALWSGIPALIASLASAVLTFVKPDEKAAQHLGAGRNLGSLRVRMRQHRELDLLEGAEDGALQWRRYAADASESKAEIDAAAPAISDRRFRAAQRKIQSGDFVHDSVEENPAG